jgi:hypothetical protein
VKRTAAGLTVLCLLASPATALANAGTPLAWATILHLLVGNIVLGALEGLALALLFHLPKPMTILWLIVANYVSAWVGWLLVSYVLPGAFAVDMHNAWFLLGSLVAAAWVATLVLEFPCIALAFRGNAHWFRKALVGTVVVQTASYVLLVGWYWGASGKSLYTDAELVPLTSISAPKDVHVYYVGAKDGAVYTSSLAGSAATKILDLGSHNANDRLFARTSATNPKRWDLVARLAGGTRPESRLVVVKESFASAAVSTARVVTDGKPPEEEETWDSFGDVPKLAAAGDSPWRFRSGFWAIEGLTGWNTATQAKIWVSFETPIAAWMVRNATHLPGDIVLFQLGEDQICLYDPATRRIALIARGRGPVAAIR